MQNFFGEYIRCRPLPQQLPIMKFIQFIYDKDLGKLIYPYRFLTLSTIFAFLAEINISDSDRQFYLRILNSDSTIKPFTDKELYNETAITKDK